VVEFILVLVIYRYGLGLPPQSSIQVVTTW